jgi:hypothetical protein
MGVVVQPSARETFTPRELAAVYKECTKHGPRYLDGERGVKAAAYCFGERALIVYEESETGLVVLIHPTDREAAFSELHLKGILRTSALRRSKKFGCSSLEVVGC